jgi:hypothetical protein
MSCGIERAVTPKRGVILSEAKNPCILPAARERMGPSLHSGRQFVQHGIQSIRESKSQPALRPIDISYGDDLKNGVGEAPDWRDRRIEDLQMD